MLRLDQLFELISGSGTESIALPEVGTDDPVQIQYTSGTTGFPKGVMLRHGGVVNNARLWVDRVQIPDGAGILASIPLFHTAGCVMCVLGALDRRAKLVLMPTFEPGLYLMLIELEQLWFAGGIQTMLIASTPFRAVRRRTSPRPRERSVRRRCVRGVAARGPGRR